MSVYTYDLCPFPSETEGGLEEWFRSKNLREKDKEKTHSHVSYVVLLYI